ncbi:MAG: PAS domain S-box protein [Nitrospiraceae bacterium]|nr:PAS domain S-box protein [Nitrospiraceae bacterium]
MDWLGIPLKIQGRTIGAFVVQSYSEIIRYGEKEKDILLFISDQIALVLDRMQKQKELQETQELLKGIFSSSPLGIAVGENRVIKWANEAMARIFGYEDMNEFIGKNSRFLYASDEEYERVAPLVYNQIEKGKPYGTDAKFRRKDGSVFDGNIVASSLNSSSAKNRTVAIFSDISWRKKAEAALNKEKESLLVTLHSIGDGVIATDASGNIVLMNGVAEELTGWEENEAIGRPLNEVFNIINEKTREVCDNPVDKVIETGRVIGLANHTMLISRDGGERILADSGAPIRDKEGKIIGIVLVFRDVTEKRRIDRELQKMEKLESTGVLAGGIAHDFNNILMGILGNISLAKMYIKCKDKALERLAEAERASLQAKNLTQQLLTFSKGGMPIKKITSIKRTLRDSVNFALSGSNVRCEYSISDDLWSVEIDEGQINQVINNIVMNAQQAMPKGGIIHVQAENVLLGRESGLPLEEGRYIKIGIEDQGIGIAKGHLPKIFDPYFTTKQKGSGLGLTTAYSIVKNHDGYISVRSELGKGTCLDIYLPASSEDIITDKTTGEISPAEKGKILLMDDEEIVRSVAGEMFRSIGYEFESAEDGMEAIEMYKKAKELGNPFDIVIMDLTIPGGMGGKEAIKRLLEIDPQVKAIVSSGYSNDPIMSDFKSYGFAGVIAKPYRMKDVIEVIHRVSSETDK